MDVMFPNYLDKFAGSDLTGVAENLPSKKSIEWIFSHFQYGSVDQLITTLQAYKVSQVPSTIENKFNDFYNMTYSKIIH